MASEPSRSRRTKWDHTPPQLSLSFKGSMPPSPPGLSRRVRGPRKPSLTEIFNQAADPRAQIAILRRKMSQPKLTLEYGTKGSVARSINPKRDRNLQKTIDALSRVIAKSQAQTKQRQFDLKTKNQITPLFNMRVKRS